MLVMASGLEALFNLSLVSFECISKFLMLGILLDGADGSNDTSVGSDLVLENN